MFAYPYKTTKSEKTIKMTRFNYSLSLVTCLLLINFTSVSFAVEADKVFPDTTKGFFSITNADQMAKQWKETQIGKLMAEPEMVEFWSDLRKQIGTQISGRLGLTLDDIRIVPSGEVAGGLVTPVGQTPGIVILMDIADRHSEAQELLVSLEKKLMERKAKKTTVPIAGETATVFTFPISEADPVERRAVYMLSGDTMVSSDQIYLVELLGKRLKGEKDASLADDPSYIATMERCAKDISEGDSEPIVRWFVRPLQLCESVRAMVVQADKGKTKQSPFQTLAEVGFDAILGIGGTVSLKSGDLEGVHRSFVYAPKPYRDSMKMIAFPNGSDFTVPHWLGADVAGSTSLFFDPLEAFDNFGPLFDATVLEGEKGGWEDILREFENDPHGFQINLREKLVKNLGRGVVASSKYDKPITPDSENIFVAVEIVDGKVEDMKDTLEKIFGSDAEMQRREFEGHILWQMMSAAEAERPEIVIGGGVPPLPGAAKPVIPAAPDPDLERENEPFFPNGVITVAFDHLLLSNNVNYLEEVITRKPDETNTLGNSSDYSLIMRTFAEMEMGKQPHFLRSFSRSAETVRPAYDMIREGKMPQSRSLLARLLNLLLTPPDMEEGYRPARIDGSKMPEFDSVQQYFGPAGVFGVTEENGWFIKGFTMETLKETPAAIDDAE